MSEVKTLTFKGQEFLVLEKNAKKWQEESPTALVLNGEQLFFCLDNATSDMKNLKFEVGHSVKQDKFDSFKNLKQGETVFVDFDQSTPPAKNLALAFASDKSHGLKVVILDPKQEIQAIFSNIKEKVLQSREKKCEIQTTSTIKI